MCELLFLLLADDAELAHLAFGLCHDRCRNGSDALSQSLAQRFGIDGVVVLHHHTARFYLDVDLELRYVQLQKLLTDMLSAHLIFRQHAHLVGIGDGRTETIVGGDACKGIVFVAQRLVEGLAHLLQEVGHRDIIDVQPEGERVDEHTHRVGYLQIGTPTAHGAEIHLAVVGIARDDIGRSGQEEVSRCDVLLSAETGHPVVIDSFDGLADVSLLVGFGQVGGYLAGSLAGLQFLSKELLCRLESLGLFGLLLVGHEVEVGVGFLLDGGAFEHLTELPDEEVGRTAVEDEMVDVHEQRDALLRLDHLEAVERRFLQVEGSDELILVLLQTLSAHLAHRNLYGCAVFGGLHDGVTLSREMHAKLRMGFHHLPNGISQTVGIRRSGEAEHVGDVVDGRRGILQTLEVDTRLGVGERNGPRRSPPYGPRGGFYSFKGRIYCVPLGGRKGGLTLGGRKGGLTPGGRKGGS